MYIFLIIPSQYKSHSRFNSGKAFKTLSSFSCPNPFLMDVTYPDDRPQACSNFFMVIPLLLTKAIVLSFIVSPIAYIN